MALTTESLIVSGNSKLTGGGWFCANADGTVGLKTSASGSIYNTSLYAGEDYYISLSNVQLEIQVGSSSSKFTMNSAATTIPTPTVTLGTLGGGVSINGTLNLHGYVGDSTSTTKAITVEPGNSSINVEGYNICKTMLLTTGVTNLNLLATNYTSYGKLTLTAISDSLLISTSHAAAVVDSFVITMADSTYGNVQFQISTNEEAIPIYVRRGILSETSSPTWYKIPALSPTQVISYTSTNSKFNSYVSLLGSTGTDGSSTSLTTSSSISSNGVKNYKYIILVTRSTTYSSTSQYGGKMYSGPIPVSLLMDRDGKSGFVNSLSGHTITEGDDVRGAISIKYTGNVGLGGNVTNGIFNITAVSKISYLAIYGLEPFSYLTL